MGPRLVKYMGSKHTLLSSGLGSLILEESKHANRLVDLFCGASSISWFAATRANLPVLATDLQQYAVTLAGSVVERTEALDPLKLSEYWLHVATRAREKSRNWRLARDLRSRHSNVAEYVKTSRMLCGDSNNFGVIWRSYGGYYFSPGQAATIDVMLDTIPKEEPMRTVCLAATISCGSLCAASPGHTAQPFQPTPAASKYIDEAWSRDPIEIAQKALENLCPLYAKVRGKAVVGDANEVASTLSSSDLVVVDPPYSGVQYSRFYHVLETISRGEQDTVSGKGRYPPLTERPQSSFSRSGESLKALVNLLERLSKAHSTVIFTFPAGECSNGLSGEIVSEVSSQLFNVKRSAVVSGRFSTLGGNNLNRAARSNSEELVLVMKR